MSLTLNAATPGSYANAQYLALACELAYLAEPTGAPGFREKLGLEAKLISVDNTQVYLGHNAEAIVLAFRGSEAPNTVDGIKDWLLTNANNFLILPEGQIGTDFASAGVGARFHKGFLKALADIWDPLYAAVDAAMKTKERPLWITGHSLGGALALVAGWRLQQSFIAVHEIYTFGAPMVGNNLAAEAFKREFGGKIHRYVDVLDVVPLLPTVSLIANDYEHCQTEYALAAAQDADPSGHASTMLKHMAGRTANGILDITLIDEIWNALGSRIEHHMIPNYQARIAEKC